MPYLRDLGVSHLYLSPIMQARQGSTHGYDVVDPRRVTGRSAYLCREGACWDLAQKRRALDRALGSPVTAHDWERLRQGIMT